MPTNMIVVTMTLHYDVSHTPSFVQRFAIIISHPDCLDKLSQILDVDVGIVGCSSTPRI
ncbi:hypothetical protein SERLA73DRAFT_136595 [Serpula lacrymans var. lacrymans S7.3]|uniref:Uncharacterized protein n=1 Tax=Serpula lacrymans var. lacrymans (strain S7.3) TaxID=936435 RepID=F8PXT5_SERL3|nr:hypothetical protein SERLA73DRAFT_136595 [Serpula lacrymans var. lacrymans S7.3]